MKNFLVTAKNPKNQTKVNKCALALLKYNQANEIRDLLENSDQPTSAINKKCEQLFDRYLTYANEVTKADLKKIEKLLY